MNKLERIANGLWAQAVCDAVGDPFEFHTRIDPASVSNYAKKCDFLNITDDTQMALFGFEAAHKLRDSSETGLFAKAKKEFQLSYIDWFMTQQETPEKFSYSTGLLKFPELHVQRAPGNTCLEACQSLLKKEEVKNNSKGCGSVMRLLPVLSINHDTVYLDTIAGITAELTHKHMENHMACLTYMAFSYSAIRDQLKEGYFSNINHIKELGEGWTAQECVNMGAYAAGKAKTFDELLEISIAHDGDSDSVGAIAGSLWGLAGKEVPTEYINKLVEKDAIQFVIDNYIFKNDYFPRIPK